MKQLIVILAALLSFAALAPQAGAHASRAQAHAIVTDGPQAGRVAASPVVRMAQSRNTQSRISPAEAKAIALSRVPGGEVVDIRRSGDVYRVRVIDRNGRVVDIVVDARSGRVL